MGEKEGAGTRTFNAAYWKARDEAVERRQEHEALRAEGDALALEPQSRGAEARLVEGNSLEQGRAKDTRRRQGSRELDRPLATRTNPGRGDNPSNRRLFAGK